MANVVNEPENCLFHLLLQFSYKLIVSGLGIHHEMITSVFEHFTRNVKTILQQKVSFTGNNVNAIKISS